MRACIHRGSRQIGGSCVELESNGKRIVIDLGLPLDADRDTEKYLPAVTGLDGSDPSLLAIIISHLHMDHAGLLGHIGQKLPVAMGRDARRILERAAPFMPNAQPGAINGVDLRSHVPLKLGPFTITPFLTDHSAYDAYALLIEADGKKLFYSGDFRMHGRKWKLVERIMAHPPQGIDVMLLEGSSLGRLESGRGFPTEDDIENELASAIAQCAGLVLAHTSSQNIDRVVSIYRACNSSGRRMVIDLYTATVLEATGNVNIPQSDWERISLFIPHSQRVQILRHEWFELLKRHSAHRIYPEGLSTIAKEAVLLFRPLHMRDLEGANCLEDSLYIYSQWEGYWAQDSYATLRAWLEKNGIQQLHIHTSGHASPGDLQRFVKALQPRVVVPIHTFNPEKYPSYFTNVVYHADTEWWEV